MREPRLSKGGACRSGKNGAGCRRMSDTQHQELIEAINRLRRTVDVASDVTNLARDVEDMKKLLEQIRDSLKARP
jgi:hypothetical protein